MTLNHQILESKMITLDLKIDCKLTNIETMNETSKNEIQNINITLTTIQQNMADLYNASKKERGYFIILFFLT